MGTEVPINVYPPERAAADLREALALDVAPAARPRPTRPLLALSLVCLIGFWAVYIVFVHTYEGQRIDDEALTGRAIAESGTAAAGDLLNTISVGALVLAVRACWSRRRWFAAGPTSRWSPRRSSAPRC